MASKTARVKSFIVVLLFIPKKDADAFYEFGKNMGIAFQLQDDILDAFAEDPKAFGKQVGGDILSNKKTYLLLTALNKADVMQKEKLAKSITAKDFDPNEKVKTMKELFIATGAKSAAEKEQQIYHTQALDALKRVSIADDKKTTLKNFVLKVMHRTK